MGAKLFRLLSVTVFFRIFHISELFQVFAVFQVVSCCSRFFETTKD